MHRSIRLSAIPMVAILLLSAGPFVAGASGTAPAGPAAVGTLEWAYGANYSGSASWTNTSSGYTATLSAHFGWHTILAQTSGADGMIQLNASRTMALDYALTFCKPDCTNPTTSGNVTFRAWQTERGFANLTNNGSVRVNGTDVPALALVNESDQVQGNLTATAFGTMHGMFNTHSTMYYFSVNASSAVSVAFTPALGLLPAHLTPGMGWSSTSEFSAVGAWQVRYSYTHVPLVGATVHLGGPISGEAAASGTVSVFGTDVGSVALDDGTITDAAALAVEGPFHLHEGFLLLPGESDVFAGGGTAWSSYQNDSASASTSAVNIAPHSPHLGLLASATSYAPQSSSPSSVGAIAAVSPVSATTTGGAVVQAQPESVSDAVQGSACLIAGNCASSPLAPGGKSVAGAFGLLLVAVLVATVIAIALVVSRRRTIPPPSHPNARLYPPGAALSPAEPRSNPRAPPPEPPADDPLGHLW